jgi:hypothetical protein
LEQRVLYFISPILVEGADVATIPAPASPETNRALLNARWELTDTRIAAELARRGTLAEGDLTEEEIARIAVEMSVNAP